MKEGPTKAGKQALPNCAYQKIAPFKFMTTTKSGLA